MWEAVVLAVPLTAGAVAWFYQKTMERQERRIARYERIMELANSMLRVARDPDGMDQILTEIRKLWLSAPKEIVEASTRFREATDTGKTSDEVEAAFLAFVQAMRRDCTIGAALMPRLGGSGLRARDVKLMVAWRDGTAPLISRSPEQSKAVAPPAGATK